MEQYRFAKFTLLIEGIHKCIQKIKLDTVAEHGIKGVHVFWLYTLLRHEGGLTATELAGENMIDRSLVSREIAHLKKAGLVKFSGNGNGRSYNSRITLTDEGRSLAEQIVGEVVEVQGAVGAGISEEELISFYATLEKLNRNFQSLTAPSGEKNFKEIT